MILYSFSILSPILKPFVVIPLKGLVIIISSTISASEKYIETPASEMIETWSFY